MPTDEWGFVHTGRASSEVPRASLSWADQAQEENVMSDGNKTPRDHCKMKLITINAKVGICVFFKKITCVQFQGRRGLAWRLHTT